MTDDFLDIFEDPFFGQVCGFESESGIRRDLLCIVQPADNDDVQLLPEGIRYNPVVQVITQEAVESKALFRWNGHRWRIISKALWNDYGHYNRLAVRYEGSQTGDSGGFEIT